MASADEASWSYEHEGTDKVREIGGKVCGKGAAERVPDQSEA